MPKIITKREAVHLSKDSFNLIKCVMTYLVDSWRQELTYYERLKRDRTLSDIEEHKKKSSEDYFCQLKKALEELQG